MEFAQILDKTMTEKNISNYEMSRKTGISDSLIGYWRRGKSVPKADNLLAISKFLEVSVDYLLGNTPNSAPVVTLNIGENLRQLRTEKNISQNEVAEKLGLSQGHLSKIENNTKRLSVEQVFELSQILDCSTDAIIIGKD